MGTQWYPGFLIASRIPTQHSHSELLLEVHRSPKLSSTLPIRHLPLIQICLLFLFFHCSILISFSSRLTGAIIAEHVLSILVGGVGAVTSAVFGVVPALVNALFCLSRNLLIQLPKQLLWQIFAFFHYSLPSRIV